MGKDTKAKKFKEPETDTEYLEKTTGLEDLSQVMDEEVRESEMQREFIQRDANTGTNADVDIGTMDHAGTGNDQNIGTDDYVRPDSNIGGGI